jgi:hypothetical protein
MTDHDNLLLLSDDPECNLQDFDLSYVDEDGMDLLDEDLNYVLDGRMDPKENQSYILGTLIVRVAGARELKVCVCWMNMNST